MQKVKTSVIGWVERRIDAGITSAGESAKTFFVEAWRIVSRIFITWITVLLGFLNKRAFEGWFTAERGRIQQRPVPPSPNSDSFEERHTMTRFASLLDESDEHNITALKSNPELTVSSGSLNSSNNNNITAPINKSRRTSRASLRPTSKKVVMPKIKYDKVDVNKDRIFSYEKVMTGFLEDLKMNTILAIDKIMNALRRWSKEFFTYLKNLTLTAILLAVLDPRRYWRRGVWAFSVVVAGSKRVINFFRPSTWKAVPHKIVAKDRLDKRRMQEIVQSHGYPYEQYTVTTEDGYILTLERLPNRKSTKVLYLQHGVIDNSYTWFAHIQGQGALAFTAFDSGYDVFVGTLRGCQGSMKHVNPNIKAKEYWNFTVNEHGFYDFPAFTNKINELKNQELGVFAQPIVIDAETGQVHPSNTNNNNNNNSGNLNMPSLSPRRGSFRRSKSFPTNILQSIVNGEKVVELNDIQDESEKKDATAGQNISSAEYRAKSKEALLGKKFEITVISHSMGAMATLMYLIKSRLDKKPHYISRAILLSPAGVHKTAPKIVPIVGPILTVLLWILPIYSFRFPSEYVRVLFAKVMEDVNRSYSMRNLISYLLSKVVGGDSIEHTFVNVHNITYNIFSGTSAGVFKHFYQIYRKGKFMAYDFGKERNMREYGQREPIDFLANYDKIDIPVYFVMGLKDTLIEPVSVITHFSTLEDHHPNLAFLKAIPKLGHIDFTVGANEELISYIMSILTEKNKASTIQ